MEKVLRLYKIPEIEEIVTVLAFVEDFYFPANAVEGDLVVNHDDTYGYRLFEYKMVYDELDWIDIQQDPSKYYCAKGDGEPQFFNTVSGVFQPYEAYFPQNRRVAEITSFTYSATRMGNAPTISGTLMYRECLDELWTDRVCVYFNKKFYFIDKIPTSEYNNTDERYKHSCELVSENKLLENVYFTNVVDIAQYQGDITKLPMQWLEFSFFGGITEFVSRLNLSLEYSGLGANQVGFRVVKDLLEPVEEKMVSISETTLKAALDLIYETWGIPYWFDGYTIHIGYSNEQQMQQAGITMPTFQYGAVQSLLSLQKSQSNEIVNRITGFGSSENIPVFYPNKNPNALEIQYDRNSTLIPNYARIANPYKTVALEPSDAISHGIPNGSYFKYMPIQKTYTYDQFMSVNTHASPKVVDEDEMPSLVLTAVEDYNCQSRYFVQEYGGAAAVVGHSASHPKYDIVCKRVWIWLHDGTTTLLSFKDKMTPEKMFDTGGAQAIIFDGNPPPRFFVKAQSYSFTREQYEMFLNTGQGFSPDNQANLIDRYFDLRTYSNVTKCVWDDSTVTDTYDEMFPIDVQNLPANTTCLSFTVGIMSYHNDPKAETDKMLTKLKTDTQLVVTHELLSDPDWSLNADGHAAQLWRYGIRLNSNAAPLENDIIYFTREEGALPYFGQLLPYSFRETNDIWLNAINNEYLKENGTDYYTFDNLYKISCAKEHVENFDDIKPTIKGMTNNESPAKRIDQILDVTFDQDDNNDLMENGTDYQHPYFFVKLAKTSASNGYGFNLFDCAIEGQTMTLNMADGNCGGCNFEVMVKYQSDGMAINPVGVFEQDTTINGVTYLQGTPKRDNTGRVLTNRNESAQQDTSAAEVWIALKKDNETFGKYDNGADVVLPDSKRGENFIPEEGDGFTIINICLPYAYIVAAEIRLYHALLDYMEKNNPRQWSFSVKFSSIYYKKHYEFMDKWLNESSQIPFIYNGITRKYFVQSYNYKMSDKSSLPEVTVELNEKVKKRNVYYAVPFIPSQQPNAEIGQLQNELKRLVRTVTGENSQPQSINVNNIHVNGDITLSNGTSVNTQIAAINSQILTNEQMQNKENIWSSVKSAAESENLFYDGLFRTRYNTFSTYHAAVQDTQTTGKTISFTDEDGAVLFEQRIKVNENENYTATMFVNATTETYMRMKMLFYDINDNLLQGEDKSLTITAKQDVEKFACAYNAPQDAEYAKIALYCNDDVTQIPITVDGVMVFNDDFTSLDQNGYPKPSSLLPYRYKYNETEFLDGGQGGGGSIELLTSPVTILDTDPGVYLLPSNCVIIYGPTSSDRFTSGSGVLEVFDAGNGTKGWLCDTGKTSDGQGSSAGFEGAPRMRTVGLVSNNSGSIRSEYFENKLSELRDINFGTWPTDGQVLSYDGNNYLWKPMTLPSIPTKTSDLTNDSGFLTSHQSIKTVNGETVVGTGNVELGDTLCICISNTGASTSSVVAVDVTHPTNFSPRNGSMLLVHFNTDVPAAASLTVIGTTLTNLYLVYHQVGITANILKSGDKALIYCINNVAHVVAIDRQSGGEVEDWQVVVTSDGDTGMTITPSTNYTVLFIDNSANTSDLTVSINTTGIDEILREYSSLVIKAYKKSRFDVKKFNQSGSVFASVKRADLVMGATGVSQFRADNITKLINSNSINSASDYMTMMNNNTIYPTLFELIGVMTFNNKVYYSYSVKEYDGSSYSYLTPDNVFNAIGIVPYDFEFIDGNTLSDSIMNYPLKCDVPVSIMFYDNTHVYRNGTTEPAQMIDFTI